MLRILLATVLISGLAHAQTTREAIHFDASTAVGHVDVLKARSTTEYILNESTPQGLGNSRTRQFRVLVNNATGEITNYCVGPGKCFARRGGKWQPDHRYENARAEVTMAETRYGQTGGIHRSAVSASDLMITLTEEVSKPAREGNASVLFGGMGLQRKSPLREKIQELENNLKTLSAKHHKERSQQMIETIQLKSQVRLLEKETNSRADKLKSQTKEIEKLKSELEACSEKREKPPEPPAPKAPKPSDAHNRV